MSKPQNHRTPTIIPDRTALPRGSAFVNARTGMITQVLIYLKFRGVEVEKT